MPAVLAKESEAERARTAADWQSAGQVGNLPYCCRCSTQPAHSCMRSQNGRFFHCS
jgi:hypothetical protein